jgi:RNA polymerase sigma-70 factor (ECF subfamily)
VHDAPEVIDADAALLEGLRAGDEAAFTELVDRYSSSMLRVARMYVPSQAVAEEVVQETWLGVLTGLERFEGRSSLKTWLFRILVNRARTRGERERRTVPFATLAGREAEGEDPAVGPERFLPADHDRWPHHWASPPERWDESPERSLQSAETLQVVRDAIERLPPMQRLVITMRDLEGWDSEEVRNALDISETNQRVLLHRARSKVRTALEAYFTS